MLLTIFNLPFNVKIRDIKDLVLAKCGINEIILDNLVPHENHTKKVTVGLAGEEDATIFMRNVNGVFMNGHRLQVVSKTKLPSLMSISQPQDGGFNSYQNNQQSSWSDQNNQQGSWSDHNNQRGSWSDQNQQQEPWSNQDNHPGSWSDDRFRARQPSPPLQPPFNNSNIPSMVPAPNYGNPNPYANYGDTNPNRNPNQSAFYMLNQSGYEPNVSAPNVERQVYSYPIHQTRPTSPWKTNVWENQQQTGRSQDSRNESRDSDFGSRKRQRDSDRWDDGSKRTWDNNRDSRSRDDGDSRWNSDRRDTTRDSNQRRNSRDPEPRSRRSERNYSPPSSQAVNRHRADDRYQRGDRSFQDRNRSRRSPPPSTQWRESLIKPPRKRVRRQEPKLDPAAPIAANKQTEEGLLQSEIEERKENKSRSTRGQLVAAKAKEILEDERFKFTLQQPERLERELRSLLKIRIDDCFKDDLLITLPEMREVYNRKFSFKSHWVILRDALLKLGGKLFTKVNAGKDFPKPKPPQVIPGGNPQVERKSQPKGVSPAPAKANTNDTMPTTAKQLIQPVQKNPASIPLAEIPGRIPQYLQGDKKLAFRQRNLLAEQLVNMHTEESFFSGTSSLTPEVKKALEDEVDQMSSMIVEACQPTTPHVDEDKYCANLTQLVPKELVKTIKISLVRRIIPMHPIMVRVFAVPPVKRAPLEDFLLGYNVTALKKSKFKPYYIATVKTTEDHDRLCLMKPVLIQDCLITFKPFHLYENKKVHKGIALRERKSLMREQNQFIGITPNEIQDDDGNIKVETRDDLYQEVKDLYDMINNDDDIIGANYDKSETDENIFKKPIKKEEYESPLKSCEDNKEIDFTSDDYTDNLIGNGGRDSDFVPAESKIEESMAEAEMDMINTADMINIADVNEDDLEDW